MSDIIENRRLAQELTNQILESLHMNLEACQSNAKHHPKDAPYWNGAAEQAQASINTVHLYAGYHRLRITPLHSERLTLVVDNTK